MNLTDDTSKDPENMTLAEHAEAWWTEQGKRVPRRDSKAYTKMYEAWVAYAFHGVCGDKKKGRRA